MVAERCARERIREWTVEETVEMPVPKIQERIGETEYMQKVVEQVTEVPRTSSRDQTLQCTEEQILDVLVPETAKQLMEVPETVSQDRIKQRTVEQIVDAPVPQAVEELTDVFRVFSQDRIQQRAMEQTTPATSLVEMIVEVPVARTPEETQQLVNTHVQHVVNTVEVERPKLVKETVQEKINQVTKHIKIPQVQFLNKVDDMLVDVQRQIPVAQTMQKAMEVPPLQYVNRVVDVPVVAPRQISPMVQTVQKTIETQQLQCIVKVIDVPVVLVAQASQLLSDVQAPTMQVVEKTVEDTQLQIVVEKTTDNPTAAAQHRSTQQHNNFHSKQAMQQRERKEEK